MRRQQNNKKPIDAKVSTANKYHREQGMTEWRDELIKFYHKTDAIRIKIKQNILRAQELININIDYRRQLADSSEDSNPITINIKLASLENNTRELEKISQTLTALVKEISDLEAEIEADYQIIKLFGEDKAYEEYKQLAAGRIDRYRINIQSMAFNIRNGQEAIEKYSPLKEKSSQAIEKNKQTKLLLDKEHEAKLDFDRKTEMERQYNIARIQSVITNVFKIFKEKNALTPLSIEINFAKLKLIAESRAKTPEKLLKFKNLPTPISLIPAVENIEKQRIEFYKTLLTILSSDSLTALEKYHRALALKNSAISHMIDTLSSYGNEVLDPDSDLRLEEIYFGTIHEYEQMMLDIAQGFHCENMKHKQALSDKLDVLQEQEKYSTLNDKQYLAQFNAYSRSFKLSKDLASVEGDFLKLQEIEDCVKTAKAFLMPSNTDSEDSDSESKGYAEAVDVNFGELTLTENAHQYLDAAAISFLDRLYSSQQNVTFRELFTFCDVLRADQTRTNIENHTGCRLPNIWASDQIEPALLTLGIPHGRHGGEEPIQDPNALSQIRAAFRNCGITAELIKSAQERHSTSASPLRVRF